MNLLTADQVGDMLQVSSITVLRWRAAGKLRGIKVPGSKTWLFRPEDVDRALLDETEIEAATPDPEPVA